MTRAPWHSADLPQRLTEALKAVRPVGRVSFQYAPEMSYGRHAGPARGDARQAAVAIILCRSGQGWVIPLTVRAASLTRHGGQVSLPGGLVEPGESSREAAGRELAEELGCHADVTWLGPLEPIFVYASNTVVTPWVAACDGWPKWIPHPPEVDRVLQFELSELMQAPECGPLHIERGPVQFHAPQMLAEGHSVWGATAVILANLRDRLQMLAVDRPSRVQITVAT
jgi:8-oxo-dGTP pyrophosphatase MutT (NUDIX family)